MATGTTAFPAFIRAEYDPSGNGFRDFEAQMRQSATRAEQQFTQAFDQIGTKIVQSLNRGLGANGKLDLGVDQLRQTTAEAKFAEQAYGNLLRTATLLARETGDTSSATRNYIAALSAQRIEASQIVRENEAQLATYTRLQAALDVTADKNSKLAQSYRETFAEAAKAAQLEVANNRFGASIAPALGARAVDNGAGYAALRDLAQSQDEADRSAKELAQTSQRLRDDLDRLQRAEAGAAEGARLVEATYRGTAAAIDATTKSASESAVIFERLIDAQSELANRRFTEFISPAASTSALSNGAGYGELARAAREADEYERQLAELRQQINPLAFEQARVNKELAFAAAAYQKGDISAEQLQARTQQLNSALVRMGGGFRDSRQAMVQTGQQLQDVAISMLSGQRAGTVLAQQLPQLAFAMSSFGGKVGKVASLLSGPWGLALVAGSFLLGAFIDKLFGADEAADKAAKSTYDFTVVLDTRMLSVTKFTDAIDQLNQSTRALIDTQALLADSSLATANVGVEDAKKRIADIDAQLKALGPAKDGLLSYVPGFNEDPTNAAKRDSLLAQRRALADSLVSAENARAQAELAIAQRRIDETIDKAAGIKGKFDRQIAELRQQRLESARSESSDPTVAAQERNRLGDRYISQAEFDRQYAELRRNQDKALEAQKAAERAQRSKALPPVTLSEVTKLVSGVLGGIVTSTTGGKHVKGSYHYSGQAVDFVPRGGMGALTKDQIRQAFGSAGIQIKELLGPGDKGHDDHFHVAFAKRRKSVEQVQDAIRRAEQQAQRMAEQLQRGIEAAAESVASLRGQFDQAPRDIDRASAAVIDLNQAIAEADKRLKDGGLTPDQRAVVEGTRKSAIETRDQIIPEFLKRPLTDQLSQQQELIDGQKLLLDGRQAEYDIYLDTLDLARMLGAQSLDELDTQIEKRGISKDQLDLYYRQTAELRRQSIELDRQRERQQLLLSIVDDVANAAKGAIYDFLDGKGISAAKNLISSLIETQKRALTEDIFTAIFGDAFQTQKLKILGLDKVDEAGKQMARTIRNTIGPLEELGKAASNAASALSSVPSAANDNAQPGSDTEIIVTAQKSAQREFNNAIQTLGNKLLGEKFMGQLQGALGGALKGAAIGEATSGVLKSLGIKQSKTGAQIGGAIGSFIPIPGGEIIGSIIGGTIGGLFKKAPKGYSVITGGGDGGFSVTGNKSGVRNDLTTASGSVQQGLSRLAEMLGGDVGNFRVSIGEYKGWYRVSSSGSSDVGSKKYPKRAGSDLLYDGQDAEAAVRAAIADAIRDGAILGISQAQQRLIAANKDLEVGVQKALDFQSVFDRLKEYKDPVGAALDTLDKEFNRLKKIFAEAGASAADYASLEELYGIERAKAIKEASEKVTASLRSLYDNLTIGDSGRSLRDRLAAAQTAYDPLKARVLAGDKTAYDDFAKAAQDLLDIQRQFSGSQTPYFNLLDEITRITKERIDAEANIASIAQNRDSPFSSTGQATGANDNVAVVGAIQQQTSDLLNGFASILAAGGDRYNFGNFRTNDFR
ncbi:MAG: hypothetical protein ACTHNA_14115 [Sphingopyxis terrae]|uniref:hypothetical protein n=1 Tax=Sphingopyxis terrae TaxID=33052 RepID=UPI003F81B8B6